MVYGKGSATTVVTESEMQDIIAKTLPLESLKGKRVLALTPDSTRTCPLPAMIRALMDHAGEAVAALDFMVALGTHTPMPEDRILALYGISREEQQKRYTKSRFLNHRWDIADEMERVGYISSQDMARLSGGLLAEAVPIDINRNIFNYDLLIILGPVFPHEVVGFSGGAKYLFPGISGGEFLHAFHWLGALITCPGIIGNKDTAVRELINQAMQYITVPVRCLAMVVKSQQELYGLYGGTYQEAWSQAADLSAEVHVVWKDRPYQTVFGVCPPMYDEIWTGGKVMYKLEQVVADGGTLIIYAPHITQVSRTWGPFIERIGYHVRDYFLANPKRFEGIPRGVLAHSTHVRGIGRMENGVEKPRINILLASAISPEKCKQISLGYLNPAEINPEDYKNREDEGILFVAKAGEIVHRLRPQS